MGRAGGSGGRGSAGGEGGGRGRTMQQPARGRAAHAARQSSLEVAAFSSLTEPNEMHSLWVRYSLWIRYHRATTDCTFVVKGLGRGLGLYTEYEG